jgi:hypothetical protein
LGEGKPCLTEQLGVRDFVVFKGVKIHFHIIKTFLVLSSKNEGFPNVIMNH